ncbi:class I SAM-dependent methyltransferase [Streptomyces pinistramenti]|uniref:class I SAM-dependent methyltransferase n=1 Tax=Streptomyces pinistramenti TaxID=2884812 RepID=UPI001D0843CB|nr:class I SAM-dependent methyltransferase [Streptomyces pinistramenti]MCB5905954.1 methyltransferase domain-containing protein [Streptomyces pinistramenti]
MTHDHHHDGSRRPATPHTHTHTHSHDASTEMDWEVLGPLLESGAELHTPVFEQAAAWLRELLTPPAADGRGPVRRILDVGSGPGVTTCLLAHAFPEAEVVAVDPSEPLLERARTRAGRLGLGDRVRTHIAELPDGLDAPPVSGDGSGSGTRPASGPVGDADLIWTSKALHHVGDQRRAVSALARHLRPGGLLAVSEGGLAARSLPRDIGIGRPGLQARLEAASEEWFTQMRAELPGAVAAVEDWPALLTEAGLHTPRSRSFLLDLPAPLSADGRAYVLAGLARTAEMYGELIDPDDLAVIDRLTDPDDPAGFAHRPDAFLLTAQTVHTARAH